MRVSDMDHLLGTHHRDGVKEHDVHRLGPVVVLWSPFTGEPAVLAGKMRPWSGASLSCQSPSKST